MVEYEEQFEPCRKIIDIKCDVCKKSCGSDCGFEYSMLVASWGYGSKFDGDNWHFHFCEKCSEELKSFIESKGGSIDSVG